MPTTRFFHIRLTGDVVEFAMTDRVGGRKFGVVLNYTVLCIHRIALRRSVADFLEDVELQLAARMSTELQLVAQRMNNGT